MLHLNKKLNPWYDTILWVRHGILRILQKTDFSPWSEEVATGPSPEPDRFHSLSSYFTKIYSNINFPSSLQSAYFTALTYVLHHPSVSSTCTVYVLNTLPYFCLACTPRTKPNPTHKHLFCRLHSPLPVQEVVSTYSTDVAEGSSVDKMDHLYSAYRRY
jgi:hypothetical protein